MSYFPEILRRILSNGQLQSYYISWFNNRSRMIIRENIFPYQNVLTLWVLQLRVRFWSVIKSTDIKEIKYVSRKLKIQTNRRKTKYISIILHIFQTNYYLVIRISEIPRAKLRIYLYRYYCFVFLDKVVNNF